MEIAVRVPAKVNVYLGVGPREDNGFHGLATVFQSLSVYDEVTIEAASEFSIVPQGEWKDSIPTDSSNLAAKAIELVAQATRHDPNVKLTIDKSIPVAAGLAGGSADAAAALVAADALWGNVVGRDALEDMADSLGSDVAFMLHGGCALGTGRGNILSPVMTRGSFHWVLATFRDGLSTPAVYSKLDELRGEDFFEEPEVPTELLAALAQGNAVDLGKHLHNDLQRAAIALRPQLGKVLDFGLEQGALGGIVSGSGPTCAFLAHDEGSAIDLVVKLLGSGLVDGALHAHGPVHGARIIPQ
jgi:4-diphosphocytidyl-2-C-methyl-D-erythritol kinase